MTDDATKVWGEGGQTYRAGGRQTDRAVRTKRCTA